MMSRLGRSTSSSPQCPHPSSLLARGARPSLPARAPSSSRKFNGGWPGGGVGKWVQPNKASRGGVKIQGKWGENQSVHRAAPASASMNGQEENTVRQWDSNSIAALSSGGSNWLLDEYLLCGVFGKLSSRTQNLAIPGIGDGYCSFADLGLHLKTSVRLTLGGTGYPLEKPGSHS